MTPTQKAWIKSMLVFVITAGLVAAAAGAAAAKSFSDLKALALPAAVAGLVAMGAYIKQSPFPMVLLLGLVLCGSPCQAQVSVQFSPEPMSVLKALNVSNVGLWDIRACNDGAAAVSLPAERLYMAAPSIHFLDPARAQAVIADARAHSVKGKILTWITYGGIAATGLTGFGAIAASSEVVASIASGTLLASQFKKQVESDLPSLGPYTGSLLTGPMGLAPGECTTRTAFAGKMKAPQTVTAVIPAPK